MARRDPSEGVALVQLGEYRRSLKIRELPADHRPFQRDGECFAAILAYVFYPVANERFLLQDVRPQRYFRYVMRLYHA